MISKSSVGKAAGSGVVNLGSFRNLASDVSGKAEVRIFTDVRFRAFKM